jgi:hypothetical protein
MDLVDALVFWILFIGALVLIGGLGNLIERWRFGRAPDDMRATPSEHGFH